LLAGGLLPLALSVVDQDFAIHEASSQVLFLSSLSMVDQDCDFHECFKSLTLLGSSILVPASGEPREFVRVLQHSSDGLPQELLFLW
jgi:hypothetical protein